MLRQPTPLLRYVAAGALVALALALRLALVQQGYLFLFFYPAVAAAAWWGGVGPGITAALLSAVVVNLVLVAPASALNLRPDDLMQAGAFVSAAGAVGWLTGRARQDAAERQRLLDRETAARAEAEAGRQRLDLLAAAGALLADPRDYEATLRRVARLAVPRLADWCTIDLVDDEGRVQRVAAAHADPAEERRLHEVATRYPMALDEPRGIAIAVRTGRTQLQPALSDAELQAAARDDEHLAILRALGARSHLIVPLVSRGRRLGALSFTLGTSGRRYTEGDVPLVEELAGRAALAIDNAELYRAERAARREAEEAVRLRDEFLSIAAHELKTPITSVHASAALLRRVTDGDWAIEPALVGRAAARVERQSEKIGRLVTQLLDLSRIEAGRGRAPPPTDLVPLVREAVAAVQATAAEHDVRVIAPTRLHATVDAVRVEQVVVNLLGNAVKYSPAGDPIEVDLSAPREGVVRVAVRDHGIGVPPALHGRLFERFVRGHDDEHRSGMGLGLYVSRQIVELHGGTIVHESPPEGGSRFVVELPRDVPRDAPAPGIDGAAPALGAG